MITDSFKSGGRELSRFGPPDSPVQILLLYGGHSPELPRAVAQELAARTDPGGFCLTAYPVLDWNRELSPWDAQPVFGNESFGHGAEETLSALLALPVFPYGPHTAILAGYSLGGLFALWAAGQTDRFRGIAAVSPSLWFPGWAEYAGSHPPKAGYVYLSLGDREPKTRHPVLQTVGSALLSEKALLDRRGIPCRFEWNPGNHFADAPERLCKGILAALQGKLSLDANSGIGYNVPCDEQNK